MFMQIIQGTIRDAEAARATMDRWLTDLEPGSDGWLGGTYGVTDDNTLVCCVRFESKEAAARNSDRPEQSAWWREMESHFAGPVTFHDCEDVTVLLGGGSDEAGFVQVMQGRCSDPDRLRELSEQSTDMLNKFRPDIIGATLAIDADGFFTETIAFISEADARKAEKREIPEEARAMFDEEMALLGDITYLDLHKPWFATHR